MALRSSFCEPSPNGFCTQELKSPAQTIIDKASCLEALCELPLTGSPRAPRGEATFLLHIFKVERLEGQGGAYAILGTLPGPCSPPAYVIPSSRPSLCIPLCQEAFPEHPGPLFPIPSSPVWQPSLSHLSPPTHPEPSQSWPPSFCIIFLPVM